MPADIPLSSHARAVDVAARALGRGETPEQASLFLQQTMPGIGDAERADIVRQAQRSREIGEAISLGFAGGAEQLYQQLLAKTLGPDLVIQAVATIQMPGTPEQPGPVRETMVRIPAPQGATLEELLALLNARAEVEATMGQGNDSPGGGVLVGEPRFAGLYEV